jgi:Protein of unknown function (DUF2855)
MADVEVRRDDLRTTRVVDGESPAEDLGDGRVQLRVERFGLTANNVTYGALGDALSYWNFFAASEDGWGRIPVWGFGDVVASGADGVAVGERFYGYFPMSSLVTYSVAAGGPGFVVTDPHRADLAAVYNQYARTPPDAPHADEMLLLRPLFATSFLIAAHLREHDHFGADAVVLSSASSKTAYGVAHLLEDVRVIGLTSARNRAFVEGLGVYDGVVAYDEVADALGGGDEALAFFDIAGDGAVREAVHRTAGDRLRHSELVGATHWDQLGGGAGDLPGPAVSFFFAPAHIERQTERLGAGGLQRAIGEAWAGFVGRLGDWMDVRHGEGPDEVQRVWRELVDGGVDPRVGNVLSLR